MCQHTIRADGVCDCGLWYDPSVLDRPLLEVVPASMYARPVSTEEGEPAGHDLSGESHPLDGPGTLSASRAESDPPPDVLEPIGALARSSITRPLAEQREVTRPLVYCPTCRDTHAEDAPHFANRTRENDGPLTRQELGGMGA